MKSDSFQIDHFRITLIEPTKAPENVNSIEFDEEVVCIGFLGTVQRSITVNHPNGEENINQINGMAISFFAPKTTKMVINYGEEGPSDNVFVAIPIRDGAGHTFSAINNYLPEIMSRNNDFNLGPTCLMLPVMQSSAEKILNNNYEGQPRELLQRSQSIELLAHFFAQISMENELGIDKELYKILNHVRELISNPRSKPPKIDEIAKMVGLSVSFLKKKFKELFGLPIYRYALNQRLEHAHKILKEDHLSIKQAAWVIGYESVGSFSNAFHQKFGYRPSAIKLNSIN